MKHYLITLISGGARAERNIIASSAIQATRIGIAMMPDVTVPFAIICKPMRCVYA